MILPRTPQTLKWHLVVLYIVFPFILCCYCLLIARNSVCTFRPFLLSCVFALKNWGNSSFCCSTCNWHVGVFTYQWDKRMVNPEIQWSGMSQTPSKIKRERERERERERDDMLNLVSDCYDDSDRTENGWKTALFLHGLYFDTNSCLDHKFPNCSTLITAYVDILYVFLYVNLCSIALASYHNITYACP